MRPTVLVLAICAAAGSGVLAQPKGHCPPGLAKRAVPCVPPGQAKKGIRADDLYAYRLGDTYRYDGRHIRLRNFERYGLPRLREGEVYYRDGNVVYRVNRETRRVLELIRLAEIVLGN